MLACSARFLAMRWGRRSGKTHAAVVGILHQMFVYGHKILVITPHERQINAIFDKINAFISSSKALRTSISRKLKHPPRIVLANGGSVDGIIVISSSGGSGGDKVRGLGAHIIYIDEADYLPDKDYVPIYAILLDNPDTQFWMTSTPTGLRSRFYKCCTDKNLGYKEWYVPATMSPIWTPDFERAMKDFYNKADYERDVHALYTEDTVT